MTTNETVTVVRRRNGQDAWGLDPRPHAETVAASKSDVAGAVERAHAAGFATVVRGSGAALAAIGAQRTHYDEHLVDLPGLPPIECEER